MKKKRMFIFCIVVFSIILIAGIVAIPKKKNLHIDSNDIACIQIRRYNRYGNITNRNEIDIIVDILNSIQYKKKHPYIRVIDKITGKDNGYGDKKVFRIELFNEEQTNYFVKDGFQSIIVDVYNSDSEMKINLEDYEILNIDEVVYEDYFKELVEKYSKE